MHHVHTSPEHKTQFKDKMKSVGKKVGLGAVGLSTAMGISNDVKHFKSDYLPHIARGFNKAKTYVHNVNMRSKVKPFNGAADTISHTIQHMP